MSYKVDLIDIINYLGDSKRPLKEREEVLRAGMVIKCGKMRADNSIVGLCLQTSKIRDYPHEIKLILNEVITTRVCAVNFLTCGPEELSQCTKSLSVLTDTGLTFVRSKEDLDMVCPDMKKSLVCVNGYSRLCMNTQRRKHFRKLFHGTLSMVHDLCENGTYQEEFLSYAPCIQKVAPEKEVCFSKYSAATTEFQTATNKQQELDEATHRNRYDHHHPYNKSDSEEAADDSLKSVCCSFEEYVDCSAQTIRRACGDDAAHFSKGFMDKMASSMIKMHCMYYSTEDCRQMGFHIEGLYTEDLSLHPFNSTQASNITTDLSSVLSLLFG